MTATATNQSTGDTSAFSNAVAAQAVSVAFSMATTRSLRRPGSVTIDVLRTGNLNVAVSVNYATSNGSAVAGQDYIATSGTLDFPPSAHRGELLGSDPGQPQQSDQFFDRQPDAQPAGRRRDARARSASATLTITNPPAPD